MSATTTVEAYAFREYDWLARIDPAYDGARRALTRIVWSPGAPALGVPYREIVAAVILGCRAYPTIDDHLRRAQHCAKS